MDQQMDTEASKIKEQLYEATQRLKFHMENSPLAVVEWDSDHRIIRWNSKAERVFGWNSGEVLGKRIEELRFVYEEDRDNVKQVMTELLDGSCPSNVNKNRNYRKDGSVIFCEWYNSVLFDASGRLVSVLSLISDVTERRRAENELKKHQEQLEELVKVRTAELKVTNEQLHQEITRREKTENILRKSEASLANAQRIAHLGNWEWDIVKNTLWWSDEIYRIFGLVPQKFGTTYEAFLNSVHPDDRAFVKRSVNEALFERKPYSIDHRIILPNNEVRIVHEEAEVIFDNSGRAIQMNGTVHDITERKREEEALRASENKYRLLVENLPQKIFYKDKDSIYVSCNENFARDLHIKPDEIIGKSDYDFFSKELADKYRADDKRIMESGKTEDIEESYLENGKELTVHTVKTPIKDEKGNVNGILGIFWDITEKITLQKEAEQSRQLALLGVLAAGIGHEINNPVNGVINCAQMLFNKSKEESRERDLAARILKEGDRIARIVHSLLSFARPVSKEKKNTVNLQEILSDTLILTGAQLRKGGIKLKVDISPKLPEIIANPQLIQQVFLNIINNAQYALNQKYPKPHDNKIIEITGEETKMNDHSSVKVTFHDYGTGIPDSIKHKIMNPFVTTKSHGKGTGLGLSLVHSIIRDHGGKLMIDSVEGEFTRVSVILPVKMKV
ncbi:MAG: PAS domain S-box protein [wastewater metagenome]|nr:PAS domain S-box protein [Candidatus Loosdrechtia aerotolerans]